MVLILDHQASSLFLFYLIRIIKSIIKQSNYRIINSINLTYSSYVNKKNQLITHRKIKLNEHKF